MQPTSISKLAIYFSQFLLISFTLTDAKLSIRSLVTQCPDEGASCYPMAANGYCQGTGATQLFVTLWSRCPCSCMAVANARVTKCCQAIGVDHDDCLSFCRRDLTVTDFLTPSVQRCSANLPHFIHCGSEGADATECCRRNGMSDYCLPLCSGLASVGCANVASLMANFILCAPHRDTIRTCYMQSNPRVQNIEQLAQWRPPC